MGGRLRASLEHRQTWRCFDHDGLPRLWNLLYLIFFVKRFFFTFASFGGLEQVDGDFFLHPRWTEFGYVQPLAFYDAPDTLFESYVGEMFAFLPEFMSPAELKRLRYHIANGSAPVDVIGYTTDDDDEAHAGEGNGRYFEQKV